jgi:hypothetical protein
MRRMGKPEEGAEYSGTAAYNAAMTMMAKSHVARAIERALAEESITRQRIVRKYAQLVNADIAEAYDENGNLKPLREIPENVRFAMTGTPGRWPNPTR